jgi:hypothetical protein
VSQVARLTLYFWVALEGITWHIDTMQIVTSDQRKELKARYPEDPELDMALKSLARSEKLLRRSLYEFGVELRADIEKFLNEDPLLPPSF